MSTRWCCLIENGPRQGRKIKSLREVPLKWLVIRKFSCNWSRNRNNCWNDNFFLRMGMVFYKQIIQPSLFFLYCHKSAESRCKQKWKLWRSVYFRDIYILYKHTKIYIHDYISHLITVVMHSCFSRKQFQENMPLKCLYKFLTWFSHYPFQFIFK